MSENRLKRTISSALWSAYGDALGFPTELASRQLVKERLGQARATRTEQWKRQIGGRFGAQVSLPAGVYSDDTQLRLSTCRAISGQGYFDVEAFAKVELPIWQAYALGGGRGTKAAANSLLNRSTNWFSNFFTGYESGGGNGAAMRVQPHVWAARNLADKPSYLIDVVRNALCTHGHMRGIAGAVVHAVSLAHVFKHERIPNEQDWITFSADIRCIPSFIKSDSELQTFWVPTWERLSKQSLESAVDEIATEWEVSVQKAALALEDKNVPAASLYELIVSGDNGLSQEERGSGIKCALFANVAALLGQRIGSQSIIEHVVNLLDSDTDTIATMAGALIGAAQPDARYLGEIQDDAYIREEAKRLYAVSQNEHAISFRYPDILYWQPPKAAIDFLSSNEGEFRLSGLGAMKPLGKPYGGRQKTAVWQWFLGHWGQTLLIRTRSKAGEALQVSEEVIAQPEFAGNTGDMFSVYERVEAQRPVQRPTVAAETSRIEGSSSISGQSSTPNTLPELLLETQSSVSREKPSEGALDEKEAVDLDAMTSEAIRSFDPNIIGRHLLELAELPNGVYLSVAYSSIVVKARVSRLRQKRKDSERSD